MGGFCNLVARSQMLMILTGQFSYLQDFFGKSDPYLEFFKQTATGWQLAHRTEVNSASACSHLRGFPHHLWMRACVSSRDSVIRW